MYYFKKNNYKMAHCVCSCGNEKDVYNSNLVSGRTKSCGCLEYENRHKYKDLTQQTFGRLTVLYPTEKRKDGSIVWVCECSCGNQIQRDAHSLLRGDVKSCGCLRKKKRNIQNQRFGNLIAVEPLDTLLNWKTLWKCRCECGNSCTVSYTNLYLGHTKSCGCLRDQEYRTLVDGTVVENLSSKLSKNNTSGVKGVYFCRGKWIAYINFKGVRHYLGSFDTIDKAAAARKNAEEKYFEPVLQKHLLDAESGSQRL